MFVYKKNLFGRIRVYEVVNYPVNTSATIQVPTDTIALKNIKTNKIKLVDGQTFFNDYSYVDGSTWECRDDFPGRIRGVAHVYLNGDIKIGTELLSADLFFNHFNLVQK